MRTAADVLTDPRPGDVVVIVNSWTRTVTGRYQGHVVFDVNCGGDVQRGLTSNMAMWRRATKDAKEITNVAQS